MKRLLITISAGIILAGAAGLAWFLWREQDAPLPPLRNPHLVVKKARRQLQVFDGAKLVKTYKIALGSAPVADKQTEGDGRTPEGDFYLAVKNPTSKFHRSLGLSYPNTEDAARGLQNNLISPTEYEEIVRAIGENRLPPQNTRLGGEIYIHGGGIAEDWTAGCIALQNEQIQELFDALPRGVPIRVEK